VDNLIGALLTSPSRVGLLSLGIGAGLVVMGFVLVIGAQRQWEWLVDPPKHARFWYSQAFVKALVGSRVLRVWTYALGVLFILGGLLNIFTGFATLAYHAR
jgi:hypothetical protein